MKFKTKNIFSKKSVKNISFSISCLFSSILFCVSYNPVQCFILLAAAVIVSAIVIKFNLIDYVLSNTKLSVKLVAYPVAFFIGSAGFQGFFSLYFSRVISGGNRPDVVKSLYDTIPLSIDLKNILIYIGTTAVAVISVFSLYIISSLLCIYIGKLTKIGPLTGIVPVFLLWSADFLLQYTTCTYSEGIKVDWRANLFTFLWSTLIVLLISLLPKRAYKFAFCTVYSVSCIYSLAQYIYFRLWQKYFFIKDMTLATEGADYLSSLKDFVDIQFILMVAYFIYSIILCLLYFPDFEHKRRGRIYASTAALITAVVIFFAPAVYGTYDLSRENVWQRDRYVFDTNNNPIRLLRITGTYEYVAHDIYVTVKNALIKDDAESYELASNFFDKQPEHKDNEYTGIFEGKNVIFVLMESVDNWLITEETTPTLYKLLNSSIKFENMHTPDFSSGYTFNSEFAFNTSLYPFTSGSTGYSLCDNYFPYSIANLFKDAGYSTTSFHFNSGNYYNRRAVHDALGYDEYISFLDYDISKATIDTILTENDDLYNRFISTENSENGLFMNFIITYSTHMPYPDDEGISDYAYSLYPEFKNKYNSSERNAIEAKVHITDDMFTQLLDRLESDGLLDNTVIVAFSDHYSYGISDKDMLYELSADKNTTLMTNTPFFIWSKDIEAQTVTKVVQTIDILPTVVNMFGIEVPSEILGHDAFDSSYSGYVYYQDNGWFDGQTYRVSGNTVWQSPDAESDISSMDSLVFEYCTVNNAILSSDYYRLKSEEKD